MNKGKRDMSDDVKGKKKYLHLGLIPDGNRRYARKMKKPPWAGHQEGARKMEQFIGWCFEYPEIKRVTLFALSSENLNRPKQEVQELWGVYKENIRKLLTDPRIQKHEIQVRILGDDGVWEPSFQELVGEVVESTKKYSKHILNILLAYGSKFEINNAIREVVKKPIRTIDKALLVREPLDLIIRTGGQYRLSNFMLYQASYAEIYFSQTLWPDFTRAEFRKILRWYYHQQKNFGE
jgi:tritrans,polycis-undecaprenyl-diphosphate synthase [geranylgeranyl-diphosphate specific]